MSGSKIEALVDLARKQEEPEAAAYEMAKAADESERPKDMCRWMQLLVELRLSKDQDLTNDERQLLSVAYKHLVGGGRCAHRDVKYGSESKDNPLCASYLEVIGKEVKANCQEALDLLENKLLPKVKGWMDKASTGGGDAKEFQSSCIFYLKMAGDYYRYLAEIEKGGPSGFEKKAEQFYLEGTKLAEQCLEATDPARLGLALNLSVCYYEILNDKTKACDLAKSAFNQAISKLDKLEEESYKDATLIMQLLRDNLHLWCSQDVQSIENEEDGEKNEEA